MTINDMLNAGIELYSIRLVENKDCEIVFENRYSGVYEIPDRYREMKIECMYANKTEYLTIEVKQEDD